MFRKFLLISLVGMLWMSSSVVTASAIGKYKWWDDNVTGSWFKNGIICFTPDFETKANMKFTYTYKLGQSKKFVNLGSGVSIAGDTQVDIQGFLPTEESTDLMEACDDGANSIAFISPKTPTQGGAYIIRLTAFEKNGKVAWIHDNKVLKVKTGVESSANFFTNPPSIFFTQDTYANISPSSGVSAYTSKGNLRNACLLIYDIAVKGGKTDGSITAGDLITSAQGGFFGVNVRGIIGQLAIPTAIKCAPWVATYMW